MNNGVIKFLVSIVVPVLLYSVLSSAYDIVMRAVYPQRSAPGELVILLVRVSLIYVILIPWLRFYYGEGIGQYLGRKPRLWRHDFMLAQLFLVGMFLLSEPLFLWLNWDQMRFEWQSDWGFWWIWFLPLLGAIFLQTSAEEMMIRGFYQGKLKELGVAKWVYLAVPSLIWAFGHQSMFRSFDMKIAVVLQMSVIGLILADWTERAGHLRGAVMVHFLMNAFTMLIYVSTIRGTKNYILLADSRALEPWKIWAYFALVSVAAIVSYRFLVLRKLEGDHAAE